MVLLEMLVELLDPASRYLRRTSPHPRRIRRRGMPRRSAIYTPIGAPPRQGPIQPRPEHRLRREIAVDTDAIAYATAEVMAGRPATITVKGLELDVVMVRFWHGDAVLELHEADQPGNRHCVRVDRHLVGDPAVIAGHLTTQVRSV
ncbi:MAG TPA: hypothetical protein VHZ97_12545, partial [Pseudonocardiaceae bacterium]|nr:hypothetical protein [Pseudonocardiaceae bacterium]